MHRSWLTLNRHPTVFLMLFGLGAAALMIVSLSCRPNSHDEGQYVAAVALMRTGLPYRDFPYLQTPLQPLLLSPFSLVSAGWLLVALRVANAFFALAGVLFLALQLRTRVRTQSLVVALAALCCTEAFLFAGSEARNDALPLLLAVAGQWLLLLAIDDPTALLRTLAGAALLGLAASTKISAALPAAGAGLYWLLRMRDAGPRPFIAFATGFGLGLLPCAVLALIAPSQFVFSVFTYSLDAPTQWWTSIRQATDLSPAFRVTRLLLLSLHGIILVGLLVCLFDRRRSEARSLLDLMILGGLVSAYLPEPAFEQYLVPLLPALTARVTFALDSFSGLRLKVAHLAILCASITGLVPTAKTALAAQRQGSDLFRTVRDGEAAAELARGGAVVTLSPERVAGWNVNLDPRFATGPFLFRTSGKLAQLVEQRTGAPNWERVGTALAVQPPSLIVVGGEARLYPSRQNRSLDAFLASWAQAHHYRVEVLPSGRLDAYVRER